MLIHAHIPQWAPACICRGLWLAAAVWCACVLFMFKVWKKLYVLSHFYQTTLLVESVLDWIYSPPKTDTESAVFHCCSESACARNIGSAGPPSSREVRVQMDAASDCRNCHCYHLGLCSEIFINCTWKKWKVKLLPSSWRDRRYSRRTEHLQEHCRYGLPGSAGILSEKMRFAR